MEAATYYNKRLRLRAAAFEISCVNGFDSGQGHQPGPEEKEGHRPCGSPGSVAEMLQVHDSGKRLLWGF